MADILSSPSQGRRHALRAIHLDMTPMVDLAFLLLTFFILTTDMVSMRSMEIKMPVPDGFTRVPENKSLTILLAPGDKLYWYQGTEEAVNSDSLHRASYLKTDQSSLRTMLRLWLGHLPGDEKFVLIKSADGARYKNLVDVLDEMLVCSVSRYSMVDLTTKEKNLLATLP